MSLFLSHCFQFSALARLLVGFVTAGIYMPMNPDQALAGEIGLGSRGVLYTVSVIINRSIKTNFILDSGASSVVLPDDVFQILIRSGTVSQNDVLGSTTVTLADGSTRRLQRLTLRELRLGNHRVENVVAVVSPHNGDALLGQTFLSRFGSVSIDNQRRVLVLSEGGPASAVQPSAVASLPSTPSTPLIGSLPNTGRFGAFAHDDNSGKYGLSWNEIDQTAAEYRALGDCNSPGCAIVFRVAPRQCGAIALTDDGKVWAGATRPTKADAELVAFEGCQKRTMLQCRIRGAECNG
jgi:hypothetical protein